MSLVLHLDRAAGDALYRQIAEQIKDRVGDGRLPPGAQLPTVRALAGDLGVTRLTVQNAYAELQSGGWVEATVGRGTFVAGGARTRLPERSAPLTADLVIDDMLEIGRVQGVRSLANASPDSRLFPADEFWGALAGLRGQAAALSEYGSTVGEAALRVEAAALLRERGLQAMPNDILITNGATQALALVTQALCRSGDAVLVEQPTYLSFLNVLKVHGVQALGVPLDGEGPLPEAVERLAVQARPRFFYTIPAFHNPTGLCMSAARRRLLLDLAERYGFLLVEDDIYGLLAYDGAPPPALKALDHRDAVIYVGSVSKTLMPSLRVGYVVAPGALHRRLLDLRRATDLCGPSLTQAALACFLAHDGLRRHLRRVLPIYRERRNTLLAALEAHMPPGVTWTHPAGGFCCWVTLPDAPVFGDLYQAALRQGWAFAPGEVFLAQQGVQSTGQSCVRVCFGQQGPEAIRSGIEALARLVAARLEQRGAVRLPAIEDWPPLV